VRSTVLTEARRCEGCSIFGVGGMEIWPGRLW
jgi:hypothetical protein